MAAVEYYPGLNASLILLSNLLDPRTLQSTFESLSELLLAHP